MTISLQFASLSDSQEVFVWSDCLLDLGTDTELYNQGYSYCGRFRSLLLRPLFTCDVYRALLIPLVNSAPFSVPLFTTVL